jgi:hypothetical protein
MVRCSITHCVPRARDIDGTRSPLLAHRLGSVLGSLVPLGELDTSFVPVDAEERSVRCGSTCSITLF